MLKRYLTVALVLATVLSMPVQPADARDRDDCKFQRVDREKWSAHENRMTIRCFSDKLHVSTRMAMLIASHESGFNENAYNPNGHGGLFQQDTSDWPNRVSRYRYLLRRYEVKNTSWRNPRANTVVSLGMAKTGGWDATWCRWADYC